MYIISFQINKNIKSMIYHEDILLFLFNLDLNRFEPKPMNMDIEIMLPTFLYFNF